MTSRIIAVRMSGDKWHFLKVMLRGLSKGAVRKMLEGDNTIPGLHQDILTRLTECADAIDAALIADAEGHSASGRGRPRSQLPVSYSTLLLLGQSHSARAIARMPQFEALGLSERTIRRHLVYARRLSSGAS